MHRVLGKGYAGGGDRLSAFGLGADFVVASSELTSGFALQGAGLVNLVTGSRLRASSEGSRHVKLESLILAQNERWRQA